MGTFRERRQPTSRESAASAIGLQALPPRASDYAVRPVRRGGMGWNALEARLELDPLAFITVPMTSIDEPSRGRDLVVAASLKLDQTKAMAEWVGEQR